MTPTCCIFDAQTANFACCLARLKAGSNKAIKSAMIATTTRSSISVKPCLRRPWELNDSIQISPTKQLLKGCVVQPSQSKYSERPPERRQKGKMVHTQ